MPTYAVSALLVLGLFLASGYVWGHISGWYSLARIFPNNAEIAVVKLNGWEGTINKMGFSGVLTFGACHSGLRFETSPFLYPFCRPFLVPWSEIETEFQKAGSWDVFNPVFLTFGHPPVARVKMDSKIWTQLAAASDRPEVDRLS
jgi:hypothetical protein